MGTRNWKWRLNHTLSIPVLLLCLLLGGQVVNAVPVPSQTDSAIEWSEPPAPETEGGGAWNPVTDYGISDALWSKIMARALVNEARLQAQGNLIATNPDATVLFDQPLHPAHSSVKPVYYALNQFYNHGTGGALVDYKNKGRTYADHWGTDYLPFPFPWNMMDNEDVQVLAAADGEIVERVSDQDDRNCSIGGPDNPNYILLKHADDSYTIYLHMAKDSLTGKGVGQYVARGEFLGLIGSSGRSTAPHLHFEWRLNPHTDSLDPFKGPGNPTIATSHWIAQEKYYVSRILNVATSGQPVTMPDCTPGTLVRQTVFGRGNTVSFAAFFRDVRPNQSVEYQILRPDGSVFRKWSPAPVTKDAPAAWWWIQRRIPGNAPLGTWKFRVLYAGQTVEQQFQVCNTVPARPKLVQPANGAFASGPQVTFKWNAPACADNYTIEVDATSKNGPIVLWDSGIRETEYTGPVMGATSFWWRISACNFVGCTNSKWWNFTMP